MSENTSQRCFATTRWSVVIGAAVRTGSDEASRALNELCRIYWPPLYAFARRQGADQSDAEDYVQGFFVDLLRRQDLDKVSPDRGRFRTFMMAAFKHYMLNQIDRQQAQKRGGDQEFVSFETVRAETWLADRTDTAPEKTFDQVWALQVLDEALSRLRQSYVDKGKEPLFDDIKGSLTGATASNYDVIAERNGCSEGAVKVAVHRLRRRYQGTLREVIAETVECPVDIDAELRYLLEVLD